MKLDLKSLYYILKKVCQTGIKWKSILDSKNLNINIKILKIFNLTKHLNSSQFIKINQKNKSNRIKCPIQKNNF